MIGARTPARRPLMAALVLLLSTGCGYAIRPPYSSNVRTVYVPVFKSISFKRDVNLQITQMVQDEIKRRTPFKVVGDPEGADATLDGTITFVDKNVMVENPNNLSRQVQGTIIASVRYYDNRSQDEKVKEIPPVLIAENAPYYPELGETTSLGMQKALKRMATQIVDMMEEPW